MKVKMRPGQTRRLAASAAAGCAKRLECEEPAPAFEPVTASVSASKLDALKKLRAERAVLPDRTGEPRTRKASGTSCSEPLSQFLRRRPAVTPVLCLLAPVWLGLLCGCQQAESGAEASKSVVPAQVRIAHLERGPISRFVTLPGNVFAYQQATLYAKVAGYLKTITVDKGDQVKEGALLAEIEVPELLADRARYRAEVEVAESDYKRLSDSQKRAPDLVVPQAVDEARGRWDIAKANLDRTDTLLNYSKIVAPFSGVITRRMVDPGAFIPAATSGSAAQNAALLTLMDFAKVRVQVPVPEAEVPFIRDGLAGKITVEELPGRAFDGGVTRYAYALDEATKTMLAEVEIPNQQAELRPGMYATVRISIETKANALLAPVEALVTEKAGSFVFTVTDGKAKRTRVQTGFNDGINFEIVSGLSADQPVILVGKQALSDGLPLSVNEAK